MEPELRFEWFGEGRNVLRIYLDYSLRPEWSPYHGPNEEEELFVEFTVTPDELTNAAMALFGELQRFPVRVKIQLLQLRRRFRAQLSWQCYNRL